MDGIRKDREGGGGRGRGRVSGPGARRDQLAESALVTLGEPGYTRTSLRDIADNAAFSPETVHDYFDDKIDLVVHCVTLDLLADEVRDLMPLLVRAG